MLISSIATRMLNELDVVLADVNVSEPWSLVTAFSELPRWKPEDVNQAGSIIAGRLRGLGVPVTVHDPELYLSIPYDASVWHNERPLRAKPPSYSRSVPDGLTGELVYVPAVYSASVSSMFSSESGREASRPVAVAGKIAITEGYGLPHKISELEQAGAIGVITINPGEDIHWAICTPIWGSPGLSDLSRKPGIPVLSVNQTDGQQLLKLAALKEAVEIRTRLDEGWFRQKVVVVEIPGTSEPEKFVLLHGHYDSWDVGVGDNATGDATLLEIARVLWNRQSGLRRSVRIAWWPGHSTGRYAGSTWYADVFAKELNDHCVAQINCDSPGCRWATDFNHLSLLPEAETFVRSVIQDVVGLPIQAERPPRAGDWSFNNIGITGLLMLSSTMPEELRNEKSYYAVGGCGGNIAWHTENDKIEIADREILLRDIKVYLACVWRIANAEVLPFDWRFTTREFRSALDRYAKAAGNHFDLASAYDALNRLEVQLEHFYNQVESNAVQPAIANRVIQDLARILVPIDHSRESRFLHDPALPVPPLPSLNTASVIASQSPELMRFTVMELRRGQNQVVDAFDRASLLVRELMDRASSKA